MAFQPVPGTASVDLNYVGGLMLNTLYVSHVGPSWSVAELAALNAVVSTWWSSSVRPLQHSGITLTDIVSRDETQEFGAVVATPVGLAGTRAGSRAPRNTAGLIQFFGETGAAPRRGWIFHVGLVDDDQDECCVAEAVRTSLDTAYTAFDTSVSDLTPTGTHVIVSRYLGTQLVSGSGGQLLRRPLRRSPNAVTNSVASVACRSVLGSQRDRLVL